MKQTSSSQVQTNYDLLLVDDSEDISSLSNRSFCVSQIEFVPNLNTTEMGSYFQNIESSSKVLYMSSNPQHLLVADFYHIDTCFLNNGKNDTFDFSKTYEIPYTKK